MSHQFAEMMEMHRKQQLMAKKKTARGALSFDSPSPAKSRKLKSPFTPPRNAADIIGATQADEDFERDSLASQSSRTTARIRLQEKKCESCHIVQRRNDSGRNQEARPRHCLHCYDEVCNFRGHRCRRHRLRWLQKK